MEAEVKKKLIDHAEKQEQEQDDDDDDDKKIEKFFAIVRRLRDARDCSTKSLHELEATKTTKKAKKVHVPVWTPSFQWEDFAETAHKTQLTSANKEHEKDKKEELDLNLTL